MLSDIAPRSASIPAVVCYDLLYSLLACRKPFTWLLLSAADSLPSLDGFTKYDRRATAKLSIIRKSPADH